MRLTLKLRFPISNPMKFSMLFPTTLGSGRFVVFIISGSFLKMRWESYPKITKDYIFINVIMKPERL